ncbi:MAG: fimbrillin family protein [Bacteroides sp.]|nr:fimbrillin family protein [Bacteroides sp.]
MQLTYKLWICMAAVAILLVACNDQNDTRLTSGSGEVIFVSGISHPATRVSPDGSQWSAGDQIGIYMTASGTTTPAGFSNVPYEAESSAASTAFKASAAGIYFPEDESPVDFIAYYPYTPTLTDWSYPVDLTDQSAGLAAHDLMYARADSNGNGYVSGSISLGFKHQLSKITLNVVDEEGDALTPDMDGVTFLGMNTTAQFDLQTGELNTITAPAAIAPYQATSNSFAAILFPASFAAGHQVSIRVDDHEYVWDMHESHPGMELKAGFSYTFRITVHTSDAEIEAILVDFGGGSISPWEDGGADNKEVEPVPDLEIPEDYQIIQLFSGGSIESALKNDATASKVAIVLANGGEYATGSFKFPASVTSLILAGKGGTVTPTIDHTGTLQAEGNMELIHFYNLDIKGVPGSNYIMNQETSIELGQILIENCKIHDMRGVLRFKENPTTLDTYTITNSILYNIGDYNLLTVDAGAVLNAEITQSTIYNVAGRGIRMANATQAATVSINECTFDQGPKYAIVEFNSKGGSLTFTNNLIGLPHAEANSVSVVSNQTSLSESGNYYVSDTSWSGTPVGEDCGFTAEQLFAKPANGNFTQSRLTAGDPRWYK